MYGSIVLRSPGGPKASAVGLPAKEHSREAAYPRSAGLPGTVTVHTPLTPTSSCWHMNYMVILWLCREWGSCQSPSASLSFSYSELCGLRQLAFWALTASSLNWKESRPLFLRVVLRIQWDNDCEGLRRRCLHDKYSLHIEFRCCVCGSFAFWVPAM